MQPRTKYKMTFLGLLIAGAVFLGVGVYALSSLTLRARSHPSVLFGGAGAVFLGLTAFWHAAMWARPLREKPQDLFFDCPRCGAIIEKDAIVCQKCGRQLTD